MRTLLVLTFVIISSFASELLQKSKASRFLKTKSENDNSFQAEWNHEVQYASCLTSINQWRMIQKTMRDENLGKCVKSCVKEDNREDWRDNNYEELREDYLDGEIAKCPRYPCSNCLAALPLDSKTIKWKQWTARCVPNKIMDDSESC